MISSYKGGRCMKKMILSIILLMTFSLVFGLTPAENGWVFDLEAHRGGRGLMPENTISAFRYAIERIGVTTLELDVAVTKDMIPVLSHDPFLNPQKVSINGKFITERPLIKDLTYAELVQYDFGIMRYDYVMPGQLQIAYEKIPTLEQVFELIKLEHERTGNKYMLNVELKVFPDVFGYTYDAQTFVNIVVPLIEKYGFEDTVMIQSFNWKVLKLVKIKNSQITTVALVQSIYIGSTLWTDGLRLADFGIDAVKMAKFIGADVLSPYYKECDVSMIKRAHESGIAIIPWTIDDQNEMKKFVDLGVDGIITDYPNLLREILLSKGINLPAPS